MVRSFCAYGLELKELDGSTHDFCTLIPALELSYETSITAITNQTPVILEKGWNPRLPQDSLRKNLVKIPPTAASFKGILDKARKHAVGDLEIVSTAKVNNIKGCKNLKDSFSGPFVITSLHGENSVELEFSEELSKKHTKFSISLIKPYKCGDAGKFPLRNKVLQHLPLVESSGTNKITKFLKEIKYRPKKLREYLVR
ncbi:hypothetical protein O181_091749 [Austropuccinia psidii MF-1]|uniref:Uncharacterized protein n=1 Tax=Austropuccinia psidii MF-1 TaxID=1389203 RepID=A0A9Q3P876_9BASI|nr:hypothetical protein [Austropuccinia psidii MF-1]